MMFWPATSTLDTSVIEPVANEWGRWIRIRIAATMATIPMAISTILIGGKFFFAVPYSSPMLKLIGDSGFESAGAAGCASGDASGDDALGGVSFGMTASALILIQRLTRRAMKC